MNTIGQHISNIRGLIEKYSRTQEQYTDQFLYEMLKSSRSEILRNEISKSTNLSEWNWQTYCMELILTNPSDCECLPDNPDCYVLRTKDKVPEAFKSKMKSYIHLSTPGGKKISLISPHMWTIYKDTDRSRYIYASFINEYIYVWNYPSNKLKCLQLRGVWRDPLDWSDIIDPNSNSPCFNPLTSNFPIDLDYQNTIYRMTLDLLRLPLQLPQDVTNDSSETIQA